MATDILIAELTKHRLSVTKPRAAVFNALLNNGPQTISQLVVLLQSSTDRATVYRTVSLFEQIGFIRRIASGWKYQIELSDMFTQHHHHITCRSCGMTQDVNDDAELDQAVLRMADGSEFQQLFHELEISGICKNCQK